jgi:hypothetical protein
VCKHLLFFFLCCIFTQHTFTHSLTHIPQSTPKCSISLDSVSSGPGSQWGLATSRAACAWASLAQPAPSVMLRTKRCLQSSLWLKFSQVHTVRILFSIECVLVCVCERLCLLGACLCTASTSHYPSSFAYNFVLCVGLFGAIVGIVMQSNAKFLAKAK